MAARLFRAFTLVSHLYSLACILEKVEMMSISQCDGLIFPIRHVGYKSSGSLAISLSERLIGSNLDRT